MSIKEFSLKTTLFIILPVFMVYTCSQVQENKVITQASCRQCIELLRHSGVTKLTLEGYVDTLDSRKDRVRKSFTGSALRQSKRLLRDLHLVPVGPVTYRGKTRMYEVILSRGQSTCQVRFYKTQFGQQLLTCPGSRDSAFEVPHFLLIADSLFGITSTKSLP